MAKILVVDDAAFMRMMLRTMLTEAGHEIVGEAANGLEAVNAYLTTKPDLVTMDITMPELDGVGAVKEIRGHDPAARIIMCSAMGQKAMVVDAISAGAKDFVVKPFQKERVVESVNKVLGL
ncbi:response regulator [Paenibacillus mucilaginosus]|uniref:CheY4 n=3 Tax=Paenibacillus mucilaginosus TaxID=61624 RepID=H6NRA6_9BACL|nr:response regulator [Paenibacillus mucilaginosus]AEI45896.1 CheY4 [Paenibacillus mucilaginosus KNP414]AFC33541.1 CheY4 [Paenibacillus mucilaginosus 3016]AFH65864.1 chemotaxis protein CheY [Paenibacillus mucilaginosus K02]MCG7216763.1 response regulator [Paenibacillus mucilaginosus]WDM27257.1 response regulator [Paenibacillus mucilaginosus]